LIDLKKIENSKHILIVAKHDTFANASVLYSYMLTQHKKVSLFRSEDIPSRLSFLPWYDKLRDTKHSTADFCIQAEGDGVSLYKFFCSQGLNINKKMATALYMGLLEEYDNFSSRECDGTIFAIASELISLGAEFKKCREHYLCMVPLATWRLKSKLYESMALHADASEASLTLTQEMLDASGATLEDAKNILREALSIVHVRKATLFMAAEDTKIIKEIKI
jgi:phosphoesterase RecJ-like protein